MKQDANHKVRQHGRSLHATLLLAAFAAASARCTEYAYSEGDRTLTVTVESGATNSFDFAGNGAYLTGNLVTNFVKRGTGTLVVEKSISDYVGDITVEAGAYRFTTNSALGRLAGEDVCGSVYVLDGATLDAHPPEDLSNGEAWGYWNKRICFAGDGVDGIGALVHSGVKDVIKRMVFSSNLVMTADAKIGNLSRYTMYMSGGINPMWLDMNGHTLTFGGAGVTAWGCWNIRNPGNIVAETGFIMQNRNTHIDGDSGNVLTMGDGTALGFNLTSGSPIRWTLDASGMKGINVLNGSAEYNKTNISCWAGPVLLGENRPRIDLKNGFWFSFYGPISGNGGLYVTSYASGPAGCLNLMGEGSTFKGGVAADRSTVALWSSGAIPADGGALMLTNSTAVLENDDITYSLPELAVHGSGVVSNGCGSWRSVVKTGNGELVWKSVSGTDRLVVKGGSVSFPASRASIAGLIESERTEYASYPATKAAWDMVFTNIITRGADAYYNKWHHLWEDPMLASSNRYMIAYTGYIWNNESTNVTWTFAGAANTHLGVRIDGTEVFYFTGTGNTGSTIRGSVGNVAPGPHTIDVRGYSSQNKGSFYPDKNLTVIDGQRLNWAEDNFGVGFDPLGRDSELQTDYVKLIDPGDGSMLTWTLPDDVEEGDTLKPSSTRKVWLLPPVGKAVFAAGTALSTGYDTFKVFELEGLPMVSGDSGCLNVVSSWIVPVADFVGGHRLSASGRLALGENAVVTLSDDSRVARSSGNVDFVVAEAAGGIVYSDSVTVAGATREWRLHLSDDGKTLYARHLPIGTKIVIR